MEQHIQLDGVPPPAATQLQLSLTDFAARKAKALIQRDGRPDLALRVAVENGGCSGLQYALTIDQRRNSDLAMEQDGVEVVVDPQSAAYLEGVTIDYVDALHGAGFKFVNPNADRTCGCGSSFAV